MKNSKQAPVFVHAVATAVPEHRLRQSEILAFMQAVQADTPEKAAFLTKIYQGSAIETRHSAIADYRRDWREFEFYPRDPALEPEPGTAARNALFVRESERLALQAAGRLFAQPLELGPADVTHLVTVSCTGFSAPGFDLDLQRRLPLPASLRRSHLGFMGCCAAFPALRLAWETCRADPAAKVLIVDVELCTLHFQKRWDHDSVVANALFADGAAAVLVSADPYDSPSPLFRLDGFATRTLPDSAGEMAWSIGDTGFDMKLSAYVPRLIQSHLPGIVDGLLAAAGHRRADLAAWAVHPGGRAILDRLADSLELPPGALAASYDVLRGYGNMSSATIFFVLDELSRRRRAGAAPAGLAFAAAFGPGLTVESALLCALPTRRAADNPRSPWAFPRLRERSRLPELMDDPAVDPAKLKRTIAQFDRLNRSFSAYRWILEREVLALMVDPGREYRLLDIGSGGGDIARWLAGQARRRGLKLAVTCIDQDERIVPWAAEACRGYPEIRVVRGDAHALPDLDGYDFMTTNHVMHHLTRSELLRLVAMAQAKSRINFVFNDLARSFWAYVGYTVYTGLSVRPSLAFYDGRLSIRRGFTAAELAEVAAAAGCGPELAVKRASPARLYLTRVNPGIR